MLLVCLNVFFFVVFFFRMAQCRADNLTSLFSTCKFTFLHRVGDECLVCVENRTSRERNAARMLCCWLAAEQGYQLPCAMCFMTSTAFCENTGGINHMDVWAHEDGDNRTDGECQQGSHECNLVAAVSSAETDNSSSTHKVNTFLSEDHCQTISKNGKPKYFLSFPVLALCFTFVFTHCSSSFC